MPRVKPRGRCVNARSVTTPDEDRAYLGSFQPSGWSALLGQKSDVRRATPISSEMKEWIDSSVLKAAVYEEVYGIPAVREALSPFSLPSP